MNPKEKVEEFKEIARKFGLKVTPQRIAVYRELVSRKDHPSAEELYETLKDKIDGISLTTVYRTLAGLENAGLVVRVPTLKDKVRYDAKVEPHNHFVCLKCGRIYDVETSYPKLNAEELDKKGFKVLSSTTLYYGICKNCRENDEEL